MSRLEFKRINLYPVILHNIDHYNANLNLYIGIQNGIKVQRKLLRELIITQKKIKTDELHIYIEEYIQGRALINKLCKFLRYLFYLTYYNQKELPSIHLHFANLESYNKYMKSILKASPQIQMGKAKAVNSSGRIYFNHVNVNHKDFKRQAKYIYDKIVWEFYAPNKKFKKDIIEDSLHYIKEINLLCQKSILGKRQKVSSLYNILINFIELKANSGELNHKIKMDYCIEAAEKNLKTHFGCEAGINEVTVLPNGAVLGCPYNIRKKSYVRHNHIDSIIKQLKNIRSFYPFRKCSVNKSYKSLRNKTIDFTNEK